MGMTFVVFTMKKVTVILLLLGLLAMISCQAQDKVQDTTKTGKLLIEDRQKRSSETESETPLELKSVELNTQQQQQQHQQKAKVTRPSQETWKKTWKKTWTSAQKTSIPMGLTL